MFDNVDEIGYYSSGGGQKMSAIGKKTSTFKERFAALLDERTESATDLAKKMHVSKQTISAWKLGDRSPNKITTIAIANFFGVNIDWLYGFDVEKYAAADVVDGLVPFSSLVRQSIPVIGRVAAGSPILAYESYDIYVDSPVKADYALTVKGDSMSPTYLDGDIVYIRQQDDVTDGTVAVVLIDDSACLKHVYKIKNGVQLVSDNPAYPPMIRTWPEYDTIRILGIVVGFTRMYKGAK